MQVAELAKELNTTSDTILKTLKSLKLKAKDSKQELGGAVVSVLKSHLKGKALPKEEVKIKEVPREKAKALKEDKESKKKSGKKEKVVPGKDKKTKEVVVKEKEAPKKAKPGLRERPPAPAPKPPMRFSKEPLITLKPLARKKRKLHIPSREDRGVSDVPLTVEPSLEKSAKEEPPAAVPPASSAPASGAVETPATTVTTAVPAVKTEIKEVREIKETLPGIEIRVPITVKDFSVKIQQKPSIVLTHLMKMGIMAHINKALDEEIVRNLIRHFGFSLAKVRTQEEQLVELHAQEEKDTKLLKPRAPVVTFMGHVDHGKTSLLDKIRSSHVADSEHGGITQHIGAYSVNLKKGKITFLDTPGHEAFTAMRARGAHITDIVVLVVAADEGIMPQTLEAIDHARAANVPIVVALNKIDHRNADPDKVKKQLTEIDLMPEDWGGKTVVVPVSALTGQGIDNLLEMILLEAELLELKANYEKKASGIVVEAHLSRGKGPVSTLIVQSGILRDADMIVAGHLLGKVKAMFDDHGQPLKEAGPSMPAEVIGLPNVPEAGEIFYVMDDEKLAKEICERRLEQIKLQKLRPAQKLTLEDIFSQIQQGAMKELNVIVKADVQGSIEALKDSLGKIPSDKIKLNFIHSGVGDINASDVLLAAVSNAIIIAFHVDISSKAREELEKQPVDVRQYRIIYDAVNDMKNALEGLLDPKLRKKFLSRVEIRQVFKLSKSGTIAGCYVLKGRVNRKANADIVRNNEVIHTGTIASLKRFKDDVRDVNEGMECGIGISGFDKYEAGDIIEVYEVESIAQKL